MPKKKSRAKKRKKVVEKRVITLVPGLILSIVVFVVGIIVAMFIPSMRGNSISSLMLANETASTTTMSDIVCGLTMFILITEGALLASVVLLITFSSDYIVKKTYRRITKFLEASRVALPPTELAPARVAPTETAAPPTLSTRQVPQVRQLPATTVSTSAIAKLPEKATIATKKRCPYCGGDLPLGDIHIFCPHCGRKLK